MEVRCKPLTRQTWARSDQLRRPGPAGVTFPGDSGGSWRRHRLSHDHMHVVALSSFTVTYFLLPLTSLVNVRLAGRSHLLSGRGFEERIKSSRNLYDASERPWHPGSPSPSDQPSACGTKHHYQR